VIYFIREGYFNNAIRSAQEGFKSLTSSSNESPLRFYLAISFILLDKNTDAVRELERLKNDENVGLGAMLGLAYTHRRFSSTGNKNSF
jgi:hypothetical protein